MADGDDRTLQLTAEQGDTPARSLAKGAINPLVTSAILGETFSKGLVGRVDLTELVGAIADSADRVRKGDLRDVEIMLISQATALNVIFAELARRGAANMGEYIETTERYLRLAFKAQAQCRATLEALAAIKNPPVVIARQANIANGPQQVNNGTNTRGRAGAHAENPGSAPNGLLEANGGAGERLDFGTAGAAIGGDPALATVGAVDRPANL